MELWRPLTMAGLVLVGWLLGREMRASGRGQGTRNVVSLASVALVLVYGRDWWLDGRPGWVVYLASDDGRMLQFLGPVLAGVALGLIARTSRLPRTSRLEGQTPPPK